MILNFRACVLLEVVHFLIIGGQNSPHTIHLNNLGGKGPKKLLEESEIKNQELFKWCGGCSVPRLDVVSEHKMWSDLAI